MEDTDDLINTRALDQEFLRKLDIGNRWGLTFEEVPD